MPRQTKAYNISRLSFFRLQRVFLACTNKVCLATIGIADPSHFLRGRASLKLLVGLRTRSARPMFEREAKERQKLSKGRGQKGPEIMPDLKGDARDKAGEAFGVSGKMVDDARQIKKYAPELAALTRNSLTGNGTREVPVNVFAVADPDNKN